MDNNLRLTNAERLILINQYKILAKIEQEDADYYNDLIFYLEHGDIDSYKYHINLSDEICGETHKEVHNILNMFELLDESYNSLPDIDKNNIEKDSITFQGFDANHDDKHNQIIYILQHKQKTTKKYHNINFDIATTRPLPRYRKMLDHIVSKQLMIKTEDGYMYTDKENKLSAADIKTLITV